MLGEGDGPSELLAAVLATALASALDGLGLLPASEPNGRATSTRATTATRAPIRDLRFTQ